jgi:hypothetical protein
VASTGYLQYTEQTRRYEHTANRFRAIISVNQTRARGKSLQCNINRQCNAIRGVSEKIRKRQDDEQKRKKKLSKQILLLDYYYYYYHRRRHRFRRHVCVYGGFAQAHPNVQKQQQLFFFLICKSVF